MPAPTEIAAYIGAAAWVPLVVGAAYRWLVRPRVTITPDRTLSLGYTRFGPIFNLNIATTAEKKDALLEYIGVTVVHENGDAHDLVWMGMAETFSQIRDAAGTQQIVEKEHQAIALRLSVHLLTERFIRFQDPSYHDAVRAVTNALAEQAIFLRANDRYNELMYSRQLHDMIQQIRGQFWWRPGRYEVRFQIRSPHRAKLRERKFTFTLLQGDADRLRSNLDLLQNDLEDVIRQGEEGYQRHNPQWQWVNANLLPA